MHKVFRITGGHNLHVINETRTGSNRIHSVIVLCNNMPKSGERDKGPATCPDCAKLDNPCNLNDDAKRRLEFFATQNPQLVFRAHEGKVRLLKADYEDADGNVTSRGRVLIDDWIKGPAPAPAVSGMVHRRKPLSDAPLCGNCGLLDGFDKMSTERYARLRALNLTVTCLACLSRPW